ncbi:MAG: hypothetical protein PHI97_10255 [Desulfobulbus sp.]|nr:hypothetical protein [Desulfobulbus sp.]
MFTCTKCGSTATDASRLCNPDFEMVPKKFCGTSAMEVCEGQKGEMKFTCDACGSMSAQPDNLCSPSKLR